MLYSTKKRNWNGRTPPKKLPHLILPVSYAIKIATQLPQGSLDVKEFSESSKLPIPEALVQQVQRISCMPSAKREYLHLGSSWNTVLNFPPKAHAPLVVQPSFLVSKKMPWTLLFGRWDQKQTRERRFCLSTQRRAEIIPSHYSILLCLFSNTAS